MTDYQLLVSRLKKAARDYPETRRALIPILKEANRHKPRLPKRASMNKRTELAQLYRMAYEDWFSEAWRSLISLLMRDTGIKWEKGDNSIFVWHPTLNAHLLLQYDESRDGFVLLRNNKVFGFSKVRDLEHTPLGVFARVGLALVVSKTSGV